MELDYCYYCRVLGGFWVLDCQKNVENFIGKNCVFKGVLLLGIVGIKGKDHFTGLFLIFFGKSLKIFTFKNLIF